MLDGDVSGLSFNPLGDKEEMMICSVFVFVFVFVCMCVVCHVFVSRMGK